MNNKFLQIEALYIHIPFCDHICSYCDFYKMIAKDSLKEKYIEYLLKELDMKKKYCEDIRSIYIGGGTPSHLNLTLLEKLFIKLSKVIDMSKVIEFTIEANPNDVSDEFAKLIRKYHINRVSLGVQSLNDNKLAFLRRNHNLSDVKNAISNLQNNGIYNINCDLIYGINDEAFSLIKKDLKILSRLNITHFSVYSLILEEKTILEKKFKENEFVLMDGDKESKLYHKIIKYLKKLGFIQYEVSNFSKRNFESIHNLTYWNNSHYLGIGAASSYYIDNVRYTNIKNLNRYFEGIDNKCLNLEEKIILKEEDQIKEEIMMGFRKVKGISLIRFNEKFNKDFFDIYPFTNDLIRQKILVFDGNYLSIHPKKMYLMNEILIKYM